MEGTWDSSPDGRRWAGVDSSNPEESERHEIQPASQPQPASQGGREGLRSEEGSGKRQPAEPGKASKRNAAAGRLAIATRLGSFSSAFQVRIMVFGAMVSRSFPSEMYVL